MEEKSIGIDLGTTHTVVGRAGTILSGSADAPTVPSAIAYLPDNSVLVGARARRRRAIDPSNTIVSAKRLIGVPYSPNALERLQPFFAPKLVKTTDGSFALMTRAGAVTPIRTAAHVIDYACTRARVSPEEIGRAVVSVPASFDERARRATISAMRTVGFRRVGVIDEPVATALAYLQRSSLRYALIYDFGGGTFDAALLDCETYPFRVRAHLGEADLGGDDIDRAIADYVAETVLREHRWDLRSERTTFERLVDACERAKTQVAHRSVTTLSLSEIDEAAPELPDFDLPRSRIVDLAEPFVNRTLSLCKAVLEQAEVTIKEIDAVFLAGGSSNLAGLQSTVRELFGKRPRVDIDPMHVVSLGASYAAVRPDFERMLSTPIRRRPSSSHAWELKLNS